MWNHVARLSLMLTVIVAVCVAVSGMASTVIAGPSQQFPVSLQQAQDTDSDELPNAFDPDSDNDSTTDSDDPAPLDPNVGAQPTPGTIDSGADNDEDELPNIHDPDDDNDSVVDQEDPAPFVPAPETPTTPPQKDEPAPSGDIPATGGVTEAPAVIPVPAETSLSNAPEPVVIALPITGSGPDPAQPILNTSGALAIAVTLMIGVVTVRLAWPKH